MSERRDDELDPALFTATVTSLTHSFGDETRRRIYLYLREHPNTAVGALATHCQVHPNVVRHHLERLTECGYVTYECAQRAGVGRPAKLYRVSEQATPESSPRHGALLVALLEQALERLGPADAEAAAHDVGFAYGRSLAGSLGNADPNRSIKDAMTHVAGLLTAHGFNARAEEVADGASVVASNCPFGSAATEHPVLCAVDRGLIAGMLEGLGAVSGPVTLTSRARGDQDCRVTA